MFPIKWNDAFRKKDGTLVNMEDLDSGGGGSELPSHTAEDAGKVLMVTDENTLAWSEVSGGNTFIRASSSTFSYSGITAGGGES